MKLDWEINEFRVLKAKVGEVTYYVAPGAVNLWEPSKRYTAFDGKVATVWPVEGGMSLTNAIAWCERDVERPEGCPAQPPAMDPVAPKTSGGMSKFPSTMDAKGWAAGFVKEGVEPQDYLGVDSEEALVAWFQAALSHGFREGQASVYELVDKAQRSEVAFGPEWAPATDPLLAESLFPNAEGDPAPPCAGGPSTLRCPACGAAEVDALTPRTVYACGSSDYDQRPGTFRQKCAREKEPPTSAQAPEPPSVEEQIKNLAWGLKNETKRAAERDNEIAERLGACEARLTQFVASKCQELGLRINEHLKKLEVKS